MFHFSFKLCLRSAATSLSYIPSTILFLGYNSTARISAFYHVPRSITAVSILHLLTTLFSRTFVTVLTELFVAPHIV